MQLLVLYTPHRPEGPLAEAHRTLRPQTPAAARVGVLGSPHVPQPQQQHGKHRTAWLWRVCKKHMPSVRGLCRNRRPRRASVLLKLAQPTSYLTTTRGTWGLGDADAPHRDTLQPWGSALPTLNPVCVPSQSNNLLPSRHSKPALAQAAEQQHMPCTHAQQRALAVRLPAASAAALTHSARAGWVMCV